MARRTRVEATLTERSRGNFSVAIVSVGPGVAFNVNIDIDDSGEQLVPESELRKLPATLSRGERVYLLSSAGGLGHHQTSWGATLTWKDEDGVTHSHRTTLVE